MENPDALLRRMSAKRLRTWEIYAELEPFGERRADMRAALIASTVFNVAVEKKHRLKLKDFMLNFEEKEPQTPEQQLGMLKILSLIHSNDTPEMQKVEDKAEAEGDRLARNEMLAQLEKARAAIIRT